MKKNKEMLIERLATVMTIMETTSPEPNKVLSFANVRARKILGEITWGFRMTAEEERQGIVFLTNQDAISLAAALHECAARMEVGRRRSVEYDAESSRKSALLKAGK
jgi:hypothetical protein